MTDDAKIREGLEHCLRNHCLGCPYARDCYSRDGDLAEQLHKDIQQLMDELYEPKKLNDKLNETEG